VAPAAFISDYGGNILWVHQWNFSCPHTKNNTVKLL